MLGENLKRVSAHKNLSAPLVKKIILSTSAKGPANVNLAVLVSKSTGDRKWCAPLKKANCRRQPDAG